MRLFKTKPKALCTQTINLQVLLDVPSLVTILSHFNSEDIKSSINFSYTSKEIYFQFKNLSFIGIDKQRRIFIASFRDLQAMENRRKISKNRLKKNRIIEKKAWNKRSTKQLSFRYRIRRLFNLELGK